MTEANRLWQIALQTPNLYYRITFLKAIATQYHPMGQSREACEINEQVVALTDTASRPSRNSELVQKGCAAMADLCCTRTEAVGVVIGWNR